jgi:hypothetical protein
MTGGVLSRLPRRDAGRQNHMRLIMISLSPAGEVALQAPVKGFGARD